MFIYHTYSSSNSLTCSFMLFACYNQQIHMVTHMCSLPRHLLTNHHSACNHTVLAIHHTQLYYMTVYHTRYMNYSVNVFLRSNWNHTELIFLSSIRSVTMLLDLVQTDLTFSYDIKGPQTSLRT